MEPGFVAAHSILGMVHERTGRYQEAIDEYRKAGELLGDNQMGRVNIEASISRVYASWGKRAEATTVLGTIAGRAEASPYVVAEIHAALGDRSKALEWLERAYEMHDVSLLSVRVDPVFEGLHGDPKFGELVRRVGLAP
jgi:tetratricopeptide (TPR) repeat protein